MSPDPSAQPWLIAGLGNPGDRYRGHRHTVGHHVVEVLAERSRSRFRAHKSRADVADARLDGRRVLLAKPHTYMNVSGPPIAALARYLKIPAEQVLVVHDELDLPFGRLRLKRGGGEGGHNGLRSTSQALATRDYVRLRFGVGRPPAGRDPADWVLSAFSGAERVALPDLLQDAANAVEDVVGEGLEAAQGRLHRDNR